MEGDKSLRKLRLAPASSSDAEGAGCRSCELRPKTTRRRPEDHGWVQGRNQAEMQKDHRPRFSPCAKRLQLEAKEMVMKMQVEARSDLKVQEMQQKLALQAQDHQQQRVFKAGTTPRTCS